MKKRLPLKLLPLLFLLFTVNFFAQEGKLLLPENATIIKLDNGIRAILIENPASPMVGINTIVKVGSAYETFATSGMSHMLEHLLFNGTETMTQKELYDATDKIGAYNNANTSEYYTNFMMVAPAENIKKAMEIQADMLFRSTLPEKKFKKEKGIVLEEIAKTLANPQSQAERIVNSVVYRSHALSLPTLGTYETIKHMKRNDVYKFYKNYYVPNNMVVSVIGNFKTEQMIKLLKEIYGSESPGVIKYPNTPGWRTGLENLNNQPGESLYYGFYKGKQTELFLLYPLKSLSDAAADLLDMALQKNSSSFKSSIKKKFPDAIKRVSISTKSSPIKSFVQVKIILSSVKTALKIKDFVSKKISGLAFNLSEDEVKNEAIKAQTEFYKNIEKPHMFGIFNAEKFAVGGIETVLESYSPASIYKAAGEIKGIRVGGNPFAILIQPIKKEEAGGKAAKVEQRLFENGAGKPVVIAKKVPGDNLLAIHFLMMHKSLLEQKFGKDAAWLWHDAFGQRMKSPEIKKLSSSYGFDFTVNDNPFIPMDNIYLDPSFGYIRVEGLSSNIGGAISFLVEQMLSFKPTRKEFNKAKQNLAFVKMLSRQNKAKKIFNKTLSKVLYDSTSVVKTKSKTTYEKLLDFGKQYFNPENIIISVVSKASPERINELFNKFSRKTNLLFGDKRALRLKFNTIAKPAKIELAGGGEQSYLYFGFQKKIEAREKPVIKALSLLLSDRIIFNIREKQGLAYRMSAGVETLGNKAMFYVNMGTMPGNVDKLIPQFPKLFSPAVADSFTTSELQKSINMYLGRMMFRRLSSINQAYYLAHSYYFDGNVNADTQFLQALKKVTLKEVQAAARKYLHVENPVLIIVR